MASSASTSAVKCFRALTFQLLFCLWVSTVAVQSQTCQRCFCLGTHALCQAATPELTRVPLDIPTSVNHLDLSTNSIVYISNDDLRNYTQLITLDLNSNELAFVSFKAFEKNTALQTLSLKDNNLRELQPYTFTTLSSLETLYLGNNQLIELEEHTFYGLDKLKTLYLDGNQLSKVPLSAMKPLKSLSRLEMSRNQIHCDCSIVWMKVYKPILDATEGVVVCTTPANLAGKRVDQIDVNELDCAPPIVEALMETVQGFKGEQGIELRCITHGNPPPKIKWHFHEQKLADSIHYRLPDNGSLLIVSMLPQLAGEYSCFVENIVGNNTGFITLEYAGARLASFIVKPEDTHAFDGGNITLPCLADQYVDEYRWEKDGVVLQPSSRIVITPGEGLTLENANRGDSGVYACVAVNEEGTVRAAAFVNVTGPLLSCEGVLTIQDVESLRSMIELAFNATQLHLKNRTHSPSKLLRRLRFPESGLIEVLKAAEIFDQGIAMVRARLGSGDPIQRGSSIPLLNQCEIQLLSELSGCEHHTRTADCSSCFHRKYRTMDGTCNNLDHPLRGASEIPFVRLLSPDYEDGIGLPRGWSEQRPSARLISRNIIAAKEVSPSEQYTLMLMQVGQFLDHDIDVAPISPSEIVFSSAQPNQLLSCDDICYNDAPCFPIQVPDNDPRISRECLPFSRSSAVCGTGAASLLIGDVGIHREQLNAITSYIDGSQIYGSVNYTASKLRRLDGSGKLKVGRQVEGRPDKYFLPFDEESLVDCNTGIHSDRSACFLGGDIRVNEQVVLTTMHTIFFREHNRVVNVLSSLNPHWDGEKLYQEARKVVIAEWQNIVYSEYLPKILGPHYLVDYSGYNSKVDATIANGFAAAAYRFGHSQIMPLFPRLDNNYESLAIGPLRLQDAFFAPFRLLDEGGIDPLLRGLISSPVKLRESHRGLNNNLTEALFAQAHEISLDLASLNIQRGRDHGLPDYNKWRVFCGLPKAETIADLRHEISNATVRSRLREVYGDDPSNIDLWVGGLVEDTLPSSQLGPTFRCIIANQFKRLQVGDRFYFEREGEFSPDQLIQLKQASLSRVICDNADNITRVPVDSFILQDSSEFVSCDKLPTVDLQLWQECQDCDEACVSMGRSRRSTLFKSLEMQDRYNELNVRVAQMEKKLGFCSYNNVYYQNNETWKTSDCKSCTCQDGIVDCLDVECSQPLCKNPIKKEGHCCPLCDE